MPFYLFYADSLQAAVPHETDEVDGESPLGAVPHQIRGFMAGFRQMLIGGQAFDKCTACSKTVVAELAENAGDLMVNCCNNSKYLEDLTGLTAMKAEMEAMDDMDMDWDDDDLLSDEDDDDALSGGGGGDDL